MKLGTYSSEEETGGGPNLTPLIDMLFLLIIFFIVTSVFVEEEKDMEIQLPSSTAAEALMTPQSPFVINIRKDGTIVVLQQVLTFKELEEQLQSAYSQQKGRSVVVRGDGFLILQKCVSVLSVVKRVGFSKYTLKCQGTGSD